MNSQDKDIVKGQPAKDERSQGQLINFYLEPGDELSITEDGAKSISELSTFDLQPSGKWPTNVKSWKQWFRFLEASPSDGLSMAELFLVNDDLQPVEMKRRLWKWWNYVFFWIADSYNVNSFQIAATGMTSGLNWWETWLAVWLGYLFSGLFVTWAARVGSYNHISFPVACRASFGIYGSMWPVINRVVMAIIWYSTQSWIFGQCIQVMLKAIFGRDLGQPGGRLSHEFSGTNTFQFLSFFLAWLAQLPAIWFPPHQIRHLFTVKAIVAPAAGICFLIWALVKAHGAGPVLQQVDTMSPHDKGWAFVYMTMNCIANYAALILNAPDFSRMARRPSDATWSQSVTIPVSFSVTSLIGILITSAGEQLYGKIMWSPLDVLDSMLQGFSRGDRGGAFLIATGLALAQLGTNICANSISAGTDLTALLPRFINIRRGGYICAAISLAICPWNFFTSSSNFTTYLSAYSVFLSCISGVVLCDYTWLRRGKLNLQDLYHNGKHSSYMYNTAWGCNWRGFLAYFMGLVPNMPGFAGQAGRAVPSGAIYLYKLNYFVGFLVSFVLYIILNLIWPPANIPQEVEGHLFDKSIWLEENMDVEDFDRMLRTKTKVYARHIVNRTHDSDV